LRECSKTRCFHDFGMTSTLVGRLIMISPFIRLIFRTWTTATPRPGPAARDDSSRRRHKG
jgi:hypothetical protein